MSNEEFENYIALVSRLLQLRGKQREQISVELRDHLQTRAAELESTGETKQAALRQAIEEFGDAAAMAKNFQSVQNLKRQRWIMRFSTFSIAGVFLAALFTMSMWPGEARFGAPETSIAKTLADDAATRQEDPPATKQLVSKSSARDLATEKALEKVIDLDYQETVFSDVKAELEKISGLNIILDETAIDDSLTHEELVTVRLRGISLANALKLMLWSYNATYVIDAGVVRIISIDNMHDPKNLRLRLFDCKNLVAKLGENGETELLDLVQSVVASDSWASTGTGNGQGRIVGGVLVVRQTDSVIRAIDDLLYDLRGKVLGETEKVVAVPNKRKGSINGPGSLLELTLEKKAVEAPADKPVDLFKDDPSDNPFNKKPAEKSTVADDPFDK